jgi:hypothetical protein
MKNTAHPMDRTCQLVQSWGAGSLWPENVSTRSEQRRLKTVTLNNLCGSCREHHARVPMHALQQQNKLRGHVFAGRKGERDVKMGIWQQEWHLGEQQWLLEAAHVRCRFACRVPWPVPQCKRAENYNAGASALVARTAD